MLNAETILALGILVNCRENDDDLTGFIGQIGHLIGGNAAAVHEQFQPTPGFFNFLEAVANPGTKPFYTKSFGDAILPTNENSSKLMQIGLWPGIHWNQ